MVPVPSQPLCLKVLRKYASTFERLSNDETAAPGTLECAQVVEMRRVGGNDGRGDGVVRARGMQEKDLQIERALRRVPLTIETIRRGIGGRGERVVVRDVR